jgi:Flp pilus assembly protein TadD
MLLILKLILVAAAVYIFFRFHWIAGVAVVLAAIGYSIFTSKAVIYNQQGKLAYMQGNIELARNWLEKAYRCRNCPAEAKLSYAYVLLKQGNPQKAEQVLDQIMAEAVHKDEIMQAKMNLGLAYWMQDRKETAYKLLQEVFSQYKNTVVYGSLGYMLLLRGDYDKALQFNLEAYEYNDTDITIIDNLGQSYYWVGQYEQAETTFERLMRMQPLPKFAEPYYYYALTLEKQRKLEEARIQILQAVDKELSLIGHLTKSDIEGEADRITSL